jgi:hypothetical protein
VKGPKRNLSALNASRRPRTRKARQLVLVHGGNLKSFPEQLSSPHELQTVNRHQTARSPDFAGTSIG